MRARVAKGIHSISYHHLLLPQHALLLAEGALMESFYPGALALAALSVADRGAVRAVILALRSPAVGGSCGDPSATSQLTTLYDARCLPLLSGAAVRGFAGPES